MVKVYYYGNFCGYFSTYNKAREALIEIIFNDADTIDDCFNDLDFYIKEIRDIDVNVYKYLWD